LPASNGDAVGPIGVTSKNSKNVYNRPMVFYNQAVALHAILVENHELRV
jgi:hypothetical protein